MNYFCISQQPCDLPRFVEFWSAFYNSVNEEKYEKYIGQELTADSVKHLFEWKNGGPLSEKKHNAVSENVIAKLEHLRILPKNMSPDIFLTKEAKGGIIWRIFLLHIWQHTKYPIFDQHVYRAMVFVKTCKIEELSDYYKVKQQKYISEYLPFYRDLGAFPQRKLDKALWTFGKFLKSTFVKMIE